MKISLRALNVELIGSGKFDSQDLLWKAIARSLIIVE